MNIKDLIEESGYNPRKKAASHGGEYSSACPFCKEGDDRFLIWPERSNTNGEHQGGRFTCRVCGKYGDAITFLRELYGLSYKEACEKLRIQPKERSDRPFIKPKPKAFIADDPIALWQEKGTAFIDWCNAQLLINPIALILMTDRGFSWESIAKFKIGFCSNTFYREREEWGLEPQEKENGNLRKLWLPMGITIPNFSIDGRVIKIKTRRTDWKEGDKLPKYVEISGSKQCPTIYGNTSLPCALILESELDALLVQQYASDFVYSVALGGSTKPLDLFTYKLLNETPLVLFCPDFDKAGAVAWAKWKKMFPNIQRILTPDGKDPGEAYLAGIDLREWLEESINEIKRKSIQM